jgi:type I restriction enzyme S subunit
VSNWETTTLGEVIARAGGSFKTGPFGTALKASEYTESGVPVISVGEVSPGALVLRRDTPRVSHSVTSRLSDYLLMSGDIVFGRKGAVDRSAWVKPAEQGWFLGSDGIRVRLPGSVDSRFVAYQLQSESVRAWLLQHSGGSTLLSLNQSTLSRVTLLLPTFAEQRAIAEVLGALDDKIAANTKLISVADELCAALTRSALNSPARQSLSSLAVLTMGTSPAGTTFNEEGHGSVFYQGVRDFGVRFPRRRVWTTSPVRFAEANDCLLSVRAPVGQVNMAIEKTCIGRGLASVRSRDDRPNTLFHLLRDAPEIWAPYEAEGTIFGSINKAQLESIEVPMIVATRAEQLEAQLAVIERGISSALGENDTLAATRDALLPQLMSGVLRVTDAEKVLEGVL